MKHGHHIRISSVVRKESREALKRLIYLNPNQPRDEEGIRRALKAHGQPRIEEIADALRIHVGDSIPQSLFAYDEADLSGHPVGVVIFSRTDPETIFIVQISVHPDYAMHGRYADVGLGVQLIDQVRAIASRVVGIRKIRIYYRRNIELPVGAADHT